MTDSGAEYESGSPRKDADNADMECEFCGGGAHSRLGNEHIWKCSEVIPTEELQELIDRWRFELAQAAGMDQQLAVAGAYEQCAEELEELIPDA